MGFAAYPKPMAKPPTVVVYNSQAVSGANTIQSSPGGIVYSGVSAGNGGDKGFGIISGGGMPASQQYRFHYTADTAW
jgi:hypothetical protein